MKPWKKKTLWIALNVLWFVLTILSLVWTIGCLEITELIADKRLSLVLGNHVVFGGLAMMFALRCFFILLLYGERVIVLPLPFPVPVSRPYGEKVSDN